MSLTLTLPNVRTQVPTLRGQVNASGPVVAAALSTIQDAFDQIARNANGLQAGIDTKSTSTSTAVAPLNATIDSISTAFTAPAADGSRQIRATIGITPPATGTWVGPHVWLEVPGAGGTFKQFDYGKLPYVTGVPLIIDHPVPAGAETWRYYVGPYSADIDKPLVRVGSFGATPSVTASVGPFSGTAGAEYCANVTGLAITLTFTNTADGQLRRFIQVGFTPPSDSRYSGALIELADTATPVHILNSVDGYTDGTVNFEEPASSTNWHVRVRARGALGTNSYVNTITPEVTQAVGATTGTIDFRQALAASIAAHLGITSGVFGVLPAGITNALVAANAIDTANLVNLAVGNSKIANFAVDAAKIALASIGNAQIDRATVNKLAVVDADIVNLSANKLTAGTIAATIAYLGTINANQVNAGTFNGIALVLNSNGITTKVDNSSVLSGFAGLQVYNSGGSPNYALVKPGKFQLTGLAGSGLRFSADSSGDYGRVDIYPSGGGSPAIVLDGLTQQVLLNNTVAINASAQFVGAGVLTPNFGHSASGFNPFVSSTQYFGMNSADIQCQVFISGVWEICRFVLFTGGPAWRYLQVRGGSVVGAFG